MPSPDPSRLPGTPAPREETIALRKSGASSKNDARFVLAVAHNAFLAYGSYDTYLEDWFGNDAVSTYIAELDGNRAGFFMLTTYHDAEGCRGLIADLVAIAVTPDCQSRGVGKRLLAHAISLAVNADPPAREMWLVVAEGNARAQRFFAGRGFRLRDGVGVYPAGQRALRMVKPLEVTS
jgi:ribosomal protein S18 acetylase RimI-like enzyme